MPHPHRGQGQSLEVYQVLLGLEGACGGSPESLCWPYLLSILRPRRGHRRTQRRRRRHLHCHRRLAATLWQCCPAAAAWWTTSWQCCPAAAACQSCTNRTRWLAPGGWASLLSSRHAAARAGASASAGQSLHGRRPLGRMHARSHADACRSRSRLSRGRTRRSSHEATVGASASAVEACRCTTSSRSSHAASGAAASAHRSSA